MFDSMDAFEKKFTPTEGGYLYYPTKRSGGKLVTQDEHEQLVENWRKVTLGPRWWVMLGIMVLAIIIAPGISRSLSLPEWWSWVIVAGVVTSVFAWLLRAAFAPRRLVRGRPDVAPPRPISEVNRQVRALFTWRFIAFALLLSGLDVLGGLNTPERTLKTWSWLIGGGAIFCLYIWLAIQKMRDR